MRSLHLSAAILLFVFTNAFASVEVTITTSPECKGSNNGEIFVDVSENGRTPIPSQLTYPLPYHIYYKNIETGDVGSGTMITTIYKFTDLKAGRYLISIFFNESCYYEGETEIAELPNPLILNKDVENIACNHNGSIKLSVTGGLLPLVYSWNNGSQASEINNLQQGEYCVTVTDQNGCNKEDCTEIIETECSANISPLVSYPEPSKKGTIEFIVLSPLPDNLIFLWNGPNGYKANCLDIQDLEAGDYCLRILCCDQVIYKKCFDIKAPDCPDVEDFEYQVINGAYGHSSISNIKQPFNFNNLKYSWTGPNKYSATTKNIANLIPGEYCVNISCGSYLILSKCYQVKELCPSPIDIIASITSPVDLCGDKVDITVNLHNIDINKLAGYYKFKNCGDCIHHNISKSEFTVDQPGVYTLYVYSLDHPDCIDEIDFVVNDVRDNDYISAQVDLLNSASCPGDYAQVIAKASSNDNKPIKIKATNITRNLTFNGSISSGGTYLFLLPPGEYLFNFYVEGICKPSKTVYLLVPDTGNGFDFEVNVDNPQCTDDLGFVTVYNPESASVKINIYKKRINEYFSDLVSSFSIAAKNRYYLNLPVGTYFFVEDQCKRFKTVNILRVIKEKSGQKEIDPDDPYTYSPEGALSYIPAESFYGTGKYLLVNENLSQPDCQFVLENGIPFSTNKIEIKDLLGGEYYYIYINYGQCCYKEKIFIPFGNNGIRVSDRCLDPDGFIEVIHPDPSCNYIWSNGSTSNQGIKVSSAGTYCVTVTCQGLNSTKIHCVSIEEIPNIEVIEFFEYCHLGDFGYITVKVSPNATFPDPISYAWYYGNNNTPFSTSPSIHFNQNGGPGVYKCIVTSAGSSCPVVKEFSIGEDPIILSCDAWKKTNPTNHNSSDGSIVFTGSGKNYLNCLWTETSSNYLQKGVNSINNLKEGNYVLYFHNPCTNFTQQCEFSLTSCDDPDFLISSIVGPHCGVSQKVSGTANISGGVPPFKVEIENADNGIFKSSSKSYKFSGIGQLLDGSHITVTDSRGCVRTTLMASQNEFITERNVDVNADPPKCFERYLCQGKELGRKDLFTEPVFDKDNCELTYYCEGSPVTYHGDRSTTIIKDTDGKCWSFNTCKFNINGKTKYWVSETPNDPIVCPQLGTSEGESYTWENASSIWDIIKKKWGDQSGNCVKFFDFKENTSERGKFTEMIGGSNRYTYCMNPEYGCMETLECGNWIIKNGTQEWENWKTIYLNKIVDNSKCSDPNTPTCPIAFKKDPKKLIEKANHSGFQVVGDYIGQSGLFVFDYNNELVKYDEGITKFSSNQATSNSEVVDVFTDNTDIKVISNYFGTNTVGQQIISDARGKTGIVTLDGGFNVTNALLLPISSWNKVLTNVNINPLVNMAVIEAPDYVFSQQNPDASTKAYYSIYYTTDGQIISNRKLSVHADIQKISTCLLPDNSQVIAYSAEGTVYIGRNSIQGSILNERVINLGHQVNSIDVKLNNGNLYLLISAFDDNSDKYSVLYKLSFNLQEAWSREFTTTGGGDVELNHLAFKQDQVMLAGQYYGSLSLGGLDEINSIYQDILVIFIDENGNYLRNFSAEGFGNEMINDILVSTTGRTLIMGCYSPEGLTIGSKTFNETNPLRQVFVYEIVQNSQSFLGTKEESSKNNLSGIKLLPNPAKDYFFITGVKEPLSVVPLNLFDIQGTSLIQNIKVTTDRNLLKVETEGLIPGLYMVEIRYANGTSTFLKFVKN